MSTKGVWLFVLLVGDGGSLGRVLSLLAEENKASLLPESLLLSKSLLTGDGTVSSVSIGVMSIETVILKVYLAIEVIVEWWSRSTVSAKG